VLECVSFMTNLHDSKKRKKIARKSSDETKLLNLIQSAREEERESGSS
jgi:hypothetical protein